MLKVCGGGYEANPCFALLMASSNTRWIFEQTNLHFSQHNVGYLCVCCCLLLSMFWKVRLVSHICPHLFENVAWEFLTCPTSYHSNIMFVSEMTHLVILCTLTLSFTLCTATKDNTLNAHVLFLNLYVKLTIFYMFFFHGRLLDHTTLGSLVWTLSNFPRGTPLTALATTPQQAALPSHEEPYGLSII